MEIKFVRGIIESVSDPYLNDSRIQAACNFSIFIGTGNQWQRRDRHDGP